ncbi:DUF2141 domain-containing protein [Fibrella forsythiae]|uniref:DUF2141 domain-containing protein n=1 Tax=Fibrella forsythiae TaxID=2817061 RepID=A0ABS3JQD9_9BACT|nr:DUF2141 domain-containing protein [Fibrella forsythiae]MBO0952226.1 DUF2141 domain-containing protein [Fibrella forsythiae]
MLIFLSLLPFLFNPTLPPVRKTMITVEVHNVRATTGKVQIGVFKPCEGFPDKCRPVESKQVTATKGTVHAVFEVDPGEYAFAVFHDLNENGKIDMRFFVPREPYGFSNNIRPRFSAPNFSECRVQIGHEPKTFSVRIE